ncbi:MAG: hypothetical protein IT384_14320 [Deltaproteobacteria bacterium]|nr:hypothetical protein [Deltaproteobacteria bacterium]
MDLVVDLDAGVGVSVGVARRRAPSNGRAILDQQDGLAIASAVLQKTMSPA